MTQWCEYDSQNYTGWPMDMASVLNCAAEVSTILAFLVMLPGACAASRKRAGEHRRRVYRPRRARPGACAVPAISPDATAGLTAISGLG